MLTTAQIEIAARKLCQLRGEDPNGHWTPKILNHQMAAIRIEAFMKPRDHAEYIEAIVFAKGQKK